MLAPLPTLPLPGKARKLHVGLCSHAPRHGLHPLRLDCAQWNYIDAGVVLAGVLSFLPGGRNVSAFRVVRTRHSLTA